MRHRGPIISGLVVALLGAMLAVAAPVRAGTNGQLFGAEGWGSYAYVGNLVVAGKTARSAIGCTALVNAHQDNQTAAVNVPGVLSTGAVTSMADSFPITGGSAAKAEAETAGVNVLDGLITATAVKAVAQTSNVAGVYTNSGLGSTLAGLVVNGTPFAITPPPNTKINLPGLGYVILNEQVSVLGLQNASMTTNAIHVVVTVLNNLPGLAKGTHIIISHAQTSQRAAIGSLDGVAYGSWARVGQTVTSGQTAVVGMPCNGTNGKLVTNQVAQVNALPLTSLGAVVNTAQGTVFPTLNGTLTSTVNNVNLVSGLVTATLVKAVASASSANGTTFTFGTAGTNFDNLTVAGFPAINDNVAANTSLSIPGLGTLWLRRVIQTPTYIEVRMIQLVVTVPGNSLGLPNGLDIRIAVAHASAHPLP